jgi:hypothetical protein
MKINGSLVFDASSASEIHNLRIQKYAGASVPEWGSADVGRIIYVTTSGNGYSANTLYIGGASAWVALATGGNAAALQTEVDNIEVALGDLVNADGEFVAAEFAGFTNVTSPADLLDVLTQLDSAISGKDSLSELLDVDVAGVGNTNLLQFNSTSGKWEDKAIGSASGVQAHDAGLDALAAFNTNGIVVQTADNTFAGRSLVEPTDGLTITNADGVAGNITFALADGLASIEALATTGFVVQSAADTFITRDLATASAGRITVTNGDGVAGSPTIDLATVTDAGTGTFLKFTRDTYGRVSGTTAVVEADITALVDSVYVNLSGDTMTGDLNMGSNLITSLGAPVAADDAATKGYVDNLLVGLTWEAPVAAVVADTTARDALVGLVIGDRVAVEADDKIYTVTDDSPLTFDAGVTLNDGEAFFDKSNETGYVFNGTALTQFTGGGQLTAGIGLVKTGNVLDVKLGAGIAELPSDEVGIDLDSPTSGGLRLRLAGVDSSATGAKLALILKSAGGLTQDADGLYIPAAGVTNAMLANDSITIDVDGGGTASVDLGASLSILGDATKGITTSVSSGDVIVSANDATTSAKGVASFDAGHFSVTSGAVSLVATLDDLDNVSGADAAATGSLLTKDATGDDWTVVSRADLVGSTSIGDHNDVTLTSPADGEVLVMNGSGQFINQKVYHLYTSGASATSHVVSHGLGAQFCNVTVVDSSNEVVIPQSITFDSTSQLTVTFNTAIDCKVVVMGIA